MADVVPDQASLLAPTPAADDVPRWAAELLSQPLAVIDLETTGTDMQASVVEIAIVDERGRHLFSSLIDPMRQIPSGAIAVHGITHERIRKINAPTLAAIWPTIKYHIQGRTLVAYNASFEARVLAHDMERFRLRGTLTQWECVMRGYAAHAHVRAVKLSQAVIDMKCAQRRTHRALDDALACWDVLAALASLKTGEYFQDTQLELF